MTTAEEQALVLQMGPGKIPKELGPRNGNCPEGYPVVNNNEVGTVAVVWADCPNGDLGAWDMMMAISYDHGETWEESWSIAPDWGDSGGITMYPFVSISENNMVSVSWYGLDNTVMMDTLWEMNGTYWLEQFISLIQGMCSNGSKVMRLLFTS